LLEGLSEGLRTLLGIVGVDVPGIKQVFFGVVLLLVVVAVPEGVWPWLARRLGMMERRK
jgi:branched-chain amino acid transport system permease protein